MTKEERTEILVLMQDAIKPLTETVKSLEQRQVETTERLTSLEQRQVETTERLTSLEQRQVETTKQVSLLRQKQDETAELFSHLALRVENEIDRAINVLGEGHIILNLKLDKTVDLESRVETLEHKMLWNTL